MGIFEAGTRRRPNFGSEAISMSVLILLDAGPLGLITNPRGSLEGRQCNLWLESLLVKGIEVKVPEIADYEVRRELLRADKIQGVKRLNEFKNLIGYVPLTTATILKAAEFWAQVRKQGKPTAHDQALDGDVILAAQAAILTSIGNQVVIATTNVSHLSRLADAQEWRNIEF